MKRLNLYLVFVFLLGFIGISHAQTADVTEGCASLEVNFTAPSGFSSGYWEFSDGQTSPLLNPTMLFSTPGTVKSDFFDTNGGNLIGSLDITVYNTPTGSATIDPDSVCVGDIVNFSNTSTLDLGISISDISWDFGDGFSGNLNNVSHAYGNAGVFDVKLEINTDKENCFIKETFANAVRVNLAPLTDFTADKPFTVCSGPLQIDFENTTQSTSSSNLSYVWDFGLSGSLFFGEDPAVQTYGNDGTYVVSLTATDEIGCSTTKTETISVGGLNADFEIRDLNGVVQGDTICAGQYRLVSLSGIVRYEWFFGNTANPISSTVRNPIVEFTRDTTYNITMIVTEAGGGCSDTLVRPIYVDMVPTDATVIPLDFCEEPIDLTYNPVIQENGSTYYWIFSNGDVSNEMNPTHTWVNPDTTLYGINGFGIDSTVLRVTDSLGCVGFNFIEDTIVLPNALFYPDVAQGCFPLEVTFMDSSTSNEPIVSWTYLFDDGSMISNTNNDPVTHVFNAPGEYNVQLVIENAAGCRDTSYAILIHVGGPISSNFEITPMEVCPGDSVFFTDLTNNMNIDAMHYYADGDRMWHCPDDQDPFWIFENETGLQDITQVVIYNGCQSEITLTDAVEVKGPVAEIDFNIECDTPNDVQFTNKSQDYTSLTWYFGDGDSSVMADVNHTYDTVGDYQVVLVAENATSGCNASRDTMTVHIRNIKAAFELDDTYCIGEEFDLSAADSEGVNEACYKGYTWFFTDRRPITTQDVVIPHFFQGKGSQTVTLVVDDINGCRDTFVDSTRVFIVEVDFAMDKDTICLPMEVDFSGTITEIDTTVSSIEWTFGDIAQGTADQLNTSYVYTTRPIDGGDLYTVTLKVEDDAGCSGELSKQIFVYEPFTNILASDYEVCVGETVQLTATDFTLMGSFLTYDWSTGGMTNTEEVTLNTSGTNNISLTVTEDATGCEFTESIDIEVQSYPQSAFTSDVDGVNEICVGTQVSFSHQTNSGTAATPFWVFDSLGVSNALNPIWTFDQIGLFNVVLYDSTSFGCKDSTSREFEIVGPVGSFTASDTVICIGESVAFSLTDTMDIQRFEWFVGGTNVDDQDPFEYTFNEAGDIEVQLKLFLNNQCFLDVPKIIEVRPEPIASFEVDSMPCRDNGKLMITNTSIGQINSFWNFDDDRPDTLINSTNFNYFYDEDGDYSIILTVSDVGDVCTDDTTLIVPILINKNVVGDVDTAFAKKGSTIRLAPLEGLEGRANEVTWISPSTGNEIDCTGEDCLSPLIDIAGDISVDSLIYKAEIGSEDECGVVTFTRKIILLKIPNTFTPNNDKINDYFTVVPPEGYLMDPEDIIEFKVFNRWGEKVYDNEDPVNGWDGNYKDDPAPSEVYTYYVTFKMGIDQVVTCNGNVTLLR